VAERSGDTAFARAGRKRIMDNFRPRESGVALPPSLCYGAASRFPPHSKTLRN
jgi:hypothetical protein